MRDFAEIERRLRDLGMDEAETQSGLAILSRVARLLDEYSDESRSVPFPLAMGFD